LQSGTGGWVGKPWLAVVAFELCLQVVVVDRKRNWRFYGYI
jgi:hypothetical protein